MKEYISKLNKVALFREIKNDELLSMIDCLNAEVFSYKKGEYIFISGDKVDFIGIVLNGNAHVLKDSYDGDRTIITSLDECDFFAEAICCAEIEITPVSVVAISNVEVLKIPFARILHSCPQSCSFHTQLIQNMLHIIARKNIILQARMDIIGKRTLRAKIFEYLQSFSIKKGNIITIPFNREELANFLCADRSALSHELARMKQDNLIDYHKNHFKLL